MYFLPYCFSQREILFIKAEKALKNNILDELGFLSKLDLLSLDKIMGTSLCQALSCTARAYQDGVDLQSTSPSEHFSGSIAVKREKYIFACNSITLREIKGQFPFLQTSLCVTDSACASLPIDQMDLMPSNQRGKKRGGEEA